MLITPFTITNLAHTLATEDFNERCEVLDSRLKDALTKAIGEEKISQVRMDRIVNRFCEVLENKQ